MPRILSLCLPVFFSFSILSLLCSCSLVCSFEPFFQKLVLLLHLLHLYPSSLTGLIGLLRSFLLDGFNSLHHGGHKLPQNLSLPRSLGLPIVLSDNIVHIPMYTLLVILIAFISQFDFHSLRQPHQNLMILGLTHIPIHLHNVPLLLIDQIFQLVPEILVLPLICYIVIKLFHSYLSQSH